MNKKISTPLGILIILLVIAAIAGAALLLCPEKTKIPFLDKITGWKTYTNDIYRFEMKYPRGWKIIKDTYCRYDDEDHCLFFDTNIDKENKDIIVHLFISDMLWAKTSCEEENRCLYNKSDPLLFDDIKIYEWKDKFKYPDYYNNYDWIIDSKNITIGINYLLDLEEDTTGYVDNIGNELRKNLEDSVLTSLKSITFKEKTLQEDMSSWKTYTNEIYGFEIKYPSYAYAQEKPEKKEFAQIIFFFSVPHYSGISSGVDIELMASNINMDVKDWYAQYYEENKRKANDLPFFLSPTGENTNLNGYSAYKMNDFGIDHGDVNFYIWHNNYIYKIHYNYEAANDPIWNEHEKITDQILSTFKFTK